MIHSIRMKVPFTVEQFLEIFRKYNEAIFPFQIGLYFLAIVAVLFVFRRSGSRNKWISSILSFFWLWMGVIYHLIYFTGINKAAYLFGVLFIIQGGYFFFLGVMNDRLQFAVKKNLNGIMGSLIIGLGLILYPILNIYTGHGYPYSPTFGLPCPTTIFTLGILFWVENKPPKILWIIPLLWSVIGFTAALTHGFYEDIGLLVAGIFSGVQLNMFRKIS